MSNTRTNREHADRVATQNRRGESTYQGKVGYFSARLFRPDVCRPGGSHGQTVTATSFRFSSAEGARRAGEAMLAQHPEASWVLVDRLIVSAETGSVVRDLVQDVSYYCGSCAETRARATR